MPNYEPVDYDPFADSGPSSGGPTRIVVRPSDAQLKTTPVDHDPFAESKPGTVEDSVKSLGSGIAKGVAGLVGLPGDVAEYGAQGINALATSDFVKAVTRNLGLGEAEDRPARPVTYGSEDIGRAIHSALKEFGINSDYKPATKAGEYAHTIGEFSPGALVPGGGGLVSRAVQVVAPALVSETAGQVTKGSKYEPIARAVGGITGGVGAGIMMRPGATANTLRQQLPEGVTPQMVTQAEALMQEAAQRGVQLAWPEALSQVAQRPVMTNMMRHLEASPQTEGRMAEFFSQRPQQVENAVRGELDNIAPANQAPSAIGPAVAREAEGHIGDIRQAINNASEPFYSRAAQVQLGPAEMARVRALPGYAQARDAVLHDPQLARYVQGMPENSVGFLNEVKKQLDQSATNARAPMNAQQNMQRAAGFEQDAAAVRNTARQASPDYDAALAIQQGGREQILQPVLDGYIGKLANRDLTTKRAIDTLFPASPIANSQHEIGQAIQTLANRHPRVANDLVRSYLEQSFNKTAKDLQTGPNQAGGAKFRTAVVGDAQQAANLEAAVTALPNGAQRWQGFNRLLEVLEATGTRQGIGSRTAYNMEINQARGAGGLVRDAAKIAGNPTKVLQPLMERYEKYKLGRNLDELARIMTDPRAGNLLRSIARMEVGFSTAQQIAARLIVIGASSRPPIEGSGNKSGR